MLTLDEDVETEKMVEIEEMVEAEEMVGDRGSGGDRDGTVADVSFPIQCEGNRNEWNNYDCRC